MYFTSLFISYLYPVYTVTRLECWILQQCPTLPRGQLWSRLYVNKKREFNTARGSWKKVEWRNYWGKCVVMNSQVRPLTSRSASSTQLFVYTRKNSRVWLALRVENCDCGGAKNHVELGSRITLIPFTWHKIAVLNTGRVSNPRAESLCKHGIGCIPGSRKVAFK